MKRYLSSSERAGLAASLSLTETQVLELEIVRESRNGLTEYLLYFLACRLRSGSRTAATNGSANWPPSSKRQTWLQIWRLRPLPATRGSSEYRSSIMKAALGWGLTVARTVLNRCVIRQHRRRRIRPSPRSPRTDRSAAARLAPPHRHCSPLSRRRRAPRCRRTHPPRNRRRRHPIRAYAPRLRVRLRSRSPRSSTLTRRPPRQPQPPPLSTARVPRRAPPEVRQVRQAPEAGLCFIITAITVRREAPRAPRSPDSSKTRVASAHFIKWRSSRY